MNTGTPLEWARDRAIASGLQSWSWALAIVLALLACAAALWLRKRGAAPLWRKTGGSPLRRLGGTRLSQKVTLEVVEFGGQQILLSVSETGAQEIAREPVPVQTGGRPS